MIRFRIDLGRAVPFKCISDQLKPKICEPVGTVPKITNQFSSESQSQMVDYEPRFLTSLYTKFAEGAGKGFFRTDISLLSLLSLVIFSLGIGEISEMTTPFFLPFVFGTVAEVSDPSRVSTKILDDGSIQNMAEELQRISGGKISSDDFYLWLTEGGKLASEINRSLLYKEGYDDVKSTIGKYNERGAWLNAVANMKRLMEVYPQYIDLLQITFLCMSHDINENKTLKVIEGEKAYAHNSIALARIFNLDIDPEPTRLSKIVYILEKIISLYKKAENSLFTLSGSIFEMMLRLFVDLERVKLQNHEKKRITVGAKGELSAINILFNFVNSDNLQITNRSLCMIPMNSKFNFPTPDLRATLKLLTDLQIFILEIKTCELGLLWNNFKVENPDETTIFERIRNGYSDTGALNSLEALIGKGLYQIAQRKDNPHSDFVDACALFIWVPGSLGENFKNAVIKFISPRKILKKFPNSEEVASIDIGAKARKNIFRSVSVYVMWEFDEEGGSGTQIQVIHPVKVLQGLLPITDQKIDKKIKNEVEDWLRS